MSATVSIIERNGANPGRVTENISNINWKAIDDVTTPYTSYLALINQGTNSYTKYIYIKFSGQFTTIANVQIKHLTGTLPTGIKLYTSPSITLDSQKLAYSTPVRTINSAITSNDFSSVGSTVNLLVGVSSSSDPATSPNKSSVADNTGTPLYTNYFISQLQTSKTATTGNVGPITIQIIYDEV